MPQAEGVGLNARLTNSGVRREPRQKPRWDAYRCRL
jgi:hypothetical protein